MALIAGETLLCAIEEESGVGEARRAARRVASDAGAGDVVAERAAIVATEAARNVLKHGGGGFVALRALDGPAAGVEVLAVDRGPGIADISAALRDGHSTAGSPGQGLGAIRRLAQAFDVWSVPGGGAVLLAEVRVAPETRLEPSVAALSVPHRAEPVCGDGWTVVRDGARTLLAVVDGLGHGLPAHQAARAALAAVHASAARGPADIVDAAHDALRSTRGAAVAVLEVRAGGAVRYAAVGNIAATIVVPGDKPRHLVSMPGTAGHEVRRVREFEYAWPDGALLVMHSDGIATRWDLAPYPGIAGRAPALVAAVLYRDFARGRDDATVLGARREGP
jgi:anti-sigma regulatory factor (Ser/Thr protein kinase)